MPKLHKERSGRMAQKRKNQQARNLVSHLDTEAERNILLYYLGRNKLGAKTLEEVRVYLQDAGLGSVNAKKLMERLDNERKVTVVHEYQGNRIFYGWYVNR